EFRGLWHQETGTGLRARMAQGPLTLYIGFDPTADSLHVGSLMQLCNLRRFQQAGHRPIALAGGGTGLIGDPGGKSEERVLLDEVQLEANLVAIRAQLARFVDFDDGGGELLDNGGWLRELSVIGFLRDVGKHFTVNDMIGKESVRARLERPDQGISYTEFSYMLLQAYDFLHLFDHHHCELQLGGSDQYGNITMGVELVRKMRGAEVFGLTSPLVLKSDGSKFGKTEAGNVWLDGRRTSPFALYQFFVRTEDAEVGRLLRYFTFLDHDDIAELDRATADQPKERRAQRELARQVCRLVHGDDETARAEQAAAALYSEEIAALDEAALLEVCAEAPASVVPRSELDGGVPVVDLLVRSGLVRSKGQARTTIEQGGAYVNNVRVGDAADRIGRDRLLFDRYLVLRRGQRDYHLVRFE
ncbi:MAG TPA: tyrosine--tRNA ligase, partial [Acidimicrobiales bacterium]|nr:tyrosine--tRNA ligase [Acidimicrobiales bacterium]